MGEASRRGTFEERKAAAIERDEREQAAQKAILIEANKKRARHGKLTLAAAMATAASMQVKK